MSNSFSESSHQGFFSRIANSLVGVLIGFLLVPGSIFLIGWNEYRTVHRTRGLLEAEKVVVEVADPLEIDNSQNNQLVHVTGEATTSSTLSDSQFGVSQVALRLKRDVEMFQWVETKHSKTRDKIGGGRETVTTYEYKTKWSADRESSENFHHPNDHENPPLRYHSEHHTARDAKLGAFTLLPDQVDRIDAWKELTVQPDAVPAKIAEEDRAKYSVVGNQLYWSATTPNANEPKVGDLRIHFRVVEPTTVSILSKQSGERLAAYETHNGEVIESIEVGTRTASEMFAALRMQNATLAWILRGVGWMLACVGFGMITGPLSALASVIPFLGRITGGATFIVSVVLGSFVALIAVGVAWIAVRPLWAILLFALAGASIYWLFRKQKQSTAQSRPPLAQLVE